MLGKSDASKEWVDGSRPLVAATVGTAFGSSAITYNLLPMMLGPIHESYGWTYTQISFGFVIYGLLGAGLSTLYGYWADRYGSRRVALLALIGFPASFSLFALMPEKLAAYYGIWALMGMFAIGTSPIIWSRAISLWFEQRRGLALGIMLMGSSLAGLIVPQYANQVIAQLGWRAAFPACSLLSVLVALPICFMWFREPLEESSEEDCESKAQSHGTTFSLALRDRRFWLMNVSIMCVALAYGGAYIHIGQIVALKGFNESDIAWVIGSVAIGIFLGRLTIGYLFDYFWAPAVVLPAMLAGGAACGILALDGVSWEFVLIAAMCLGISSGAESDAIAYLVSRYFGMLHYGRIFGALFVPYAVGTSVSPLGYGVIRDAFGSYNRALIAAMALYVAGATLLLLLGRYPVWDRTSAEISYAA